MNLALPHRKTLIEQINPAIAAFAMVMVGIIVIPVHYPVIPSKGHITPNIVRPMERAEVHWKQHWYDLCPVTVTREFIGSDGIQKVGVPYVLQPPQIKGDTPFDGTIIIPDLPPGETGYQATLQPHCWIDAIWQRVYKTDEIKITMLPALPPSGPR